MERLEQARLRQAFFIVERIEGDARACLEGKKVTMHALRAYAGDDLRRVLAAGRLPR